MVAQASDTVVDLTASEEEIIPYLPTRLTYQQIGDQLHISLSTIKTHLRNIYQKLGVSTRDEAINRCRALQLL